MVMGALSASSPALPRHVGQPTASATSARPVYVVAPLSVLIKSGEGVGAKRSGSLCLPAGGLVWREVKPDADEIITALVGRLRASGLDVRRQDDSVDLGTVAPAVLVTGELLAIKVNACVPPGGLGRLLNRSTTVKGGGSIHVRWSVQTPENPGRVWTLQSCPTFNYREKKGSLADLVLAGVSQATDDLARHLADEQSGSFIPSDGSSTAFPCPAPGRDHPSAEPG